MSFNIISDDNGVVCAGGMSAEICFAKYIAFAKNKLYSGWNNSIRMIYDNCMIDSINHVVDQVTKVESPVIEYQEDFVCGFPISKQILNSVHKKCAILSPGFLTVPYMVEFMNAVYLPTQFLVGIDNINNLRSMLAKTSSMGIKCYALVGYDACISNCLVAWIKLLEIPKQYLDLLSIMGISETICIGVYNGSKIGLGENIARGYQIDGPLNEQNIYMMYINETYSSTRDIDDQLFLKFLPDFDPKIVSDRSPHINDWESGFDNLPFFSENYTGNTHNFYANDTLPLYHISFELSKRFAFLNSIRIKGIVLNNYFINNPIHEISQGFLAVSYWQQNPDAVSIINKTIQYDLNSSHAIWINHHRGDNIQPILDRFKDHRHLSICNSSPFLQETKECISKFAPLNNSKYKYLNTNIFRMTCNDIGISHF